MSRMHKPPLANTSKADADLATVLRNTKSMQGVTLDQVTDAKNRHYAARRRFKANPMSAAAGCSGIPIGRRAAGQRQGCEAPCGCAQEQHRRDITSAVGADDEQGELRCGDVAAIQTNLKTATSPMHRPC